MPFFIASRTRSNQTVVVARVAFATREEAEARAVARYGGTWYRIIEANTSMQAARLVRP